MHSLSISSLLILTDVASPMQSSLEDPGKRRRLPQPADMDLMGNGALEEAALVTVA